MGDMVLIWSMEHGAWWRPDSCGYTANLLEAGLYARAKAQAIVDGSHGRNERIVEVPRVQWPAGSLGAALDESHEAGLEFMQDCVRDLVSASTGLRDAAIRYITKGRVGRGEEEALRAAIARVDTLCTESQEAGR